MPAARSRRPLIVDDLPLSAPSDIAANGAHHGYRQLTLYANGKPTEWADRFADLLAPYMPVWDAWISWLEPGGYVRRHVDAGPHRERWQIPIRPAGTMNGQRTGTEPFQVRHWEPHDVRNQDATPRIHLVLDRDVIVRAEATPFRLED